MKKLLYIIFATLAASCVGGSVSRPTEAAPLDSDSVPTIVNIIDTAIASDTTLMVLSPKQMDSLEFRLTHHYSENFNFLVKADSLMLIPREGDLITDTCHVHRGDIIAVAAIKTIHTDSIDSVWVKVASSQRVMGWIPETDLLKGATPDDTISQLLNILSDSRAIWMSAVIMLGAVAIVLGRKKDMRTWQPAQILNELRAWHPQGFLEEMNSIYPALFLLLVALMASLYASVQNLVPEFWQEYYFHPTLNPLVLPPLMATLVVMMWLVIITYLAVIDEIYHHFYFLPGMTYLAKLTGAAMCIYLVVSWTTLIYVGYILLAVLVYYLSKIMMKNLFTRDA